MTDLLQRAEQNIQTRRLLKRGQAVLVGVSGGLDSMVLLHMLHKLSARHGWRLTVAHFNHCLRGRSSDADEKLVRRTAAALKLRLVAGRVDVKGFARESKLSIEMAARKLRHEFFGRTAQERKIPVVALAHHADDQVELFFLRVLRGAGGEGLAGMKWRSPSPVDPKTMLVRPLLGATKEGLYRFARQHKVFFHEDATNARLEMPRNRVRNELLPLLRRHYQPALTNTVLRLMEIVGAEAEVIRGMAERWLNARRPGFGHLPVALQRRILQLQLARLGAAMDFELIEQLRRTADHPVSVGPGWSVSRNAAGKVNFRAAPRMEFNSNAMALSLAGGAGDAEFDGVRLVWRPGGARDFIRRTGQKGRELFDADKVGVRIMLRHWRPGDRFQPIGLKSAAKLQDLFTNRKIPRDRRRDLVVAATRRGEIFWVEGLRMAEQFKLTSRTKRCLVWRWRRATGFGPAAGSLEFRAFLHPKTIRESALHGKCE